MLCTGNYYIDRHFSICNSNKQNSSIHNSSSNIIIINNNNNNNKTTTTTTTTTTTKQQPRQRHRQWQRQRQRQRQPQQHQQSSTHLGLGLQWLDTCSAMDTKNHKHCEFWFVFQMCIKTQSKTERHVEHKFRFRQTHWSLCIFCQFHSLIHLL